MMERTGHYAYRRAPGYQLLRLPYRGGRTSMYVLLPATGVTGAQLVAGFVSNGWPASLVGADFGAFHVLLPRFKAEQTTALRASLKAIGFEMAFDATRADLRGVARWKNSDRAADLYVSEALQRVWRA